MAKRSTLQPTLTIGTSALVWIYVGRLMEIKALCVLFVLHPYGIRIQIRDFAAKNRAIWPACGSRHAWRVGRII